MRPAPATRSGQRQAGWAATLLRVSILALLIVIGNMAASAAIDWIDYEIWPQHLETLDRAVLAAMILYVALMVMPFVPGIEIGLLLMMLLGTRGVALVYLATLLALSLAFGIGRLLPPPALSALLGWLRLQSAAEMAARYSAVAPEHRLDFLAEHASTRLVPSLLRRRYLLLAVLLNLPGNALIGGGGGIALLAGLSGLYTFPRFLLLIAAAVLPGPLLILFSESVRG